MAGREEQKRREWHVEQAVTNAKCELAAKVLAAVNAIPAGLCDVDYKTPESVEHLKRDDVISAVEQVFTNSGVEVERR